jgi:histidinol dehydrogenase
MKTYYEKKLTREDYGNLLRRPGDTTEQIQVVVRDICLDIRKNGDTAVKEYSERYEPIAVERFRVTREEFEEARVGVPEKVLHAVGVAADNIRTFHNDQVRKSVDIVISKGIVCRREIRPYDIVGLYVPAGSAPLPSTVMMLGIPAKLAGCERIIISSPPNAAGKIDPSVLVTAEEIGIDEIYKVGGAQAIAAMAYGTETIPRVEKIFGPGNRYVTAAKQFIATDPLGAAIDLVAGPSELLVIADDTAMPKLVAVDLLSQAEHDPYSQVVLVTTSPILAEQVDSEIARLVIDMPRRKIIDQSLDKSFSLIVDTLDAALKFSNDYAPEHLSIHCEHPDELVPRIKNAGSVFLGRYSPVTAGDYASGTNHTLPTGGTARWQSGVTVESFQKTMTIQSLSKEGLESLAPTLITLTETEGLEAHKRAVTERLTDAD